MPRRYYDESESFAESFMGGITTGIQLRRSMEQTRALMEDRENKHRATQIMQELQTELSAIDTRRGLVDQQAKQSLVDMDSGVMPATVEGIGAATKTLMLSGLESAGSKRDALARAIARDPSNQWLLDSTLKVGSLIESFERGEIERLNAIDARAIEQEKLALETRRTDSTISVDRFQEADLAASAGLKGAQTAGVRQDTAFDAQLQPDRVRTGAATARSAEAKATGDEMDLAYGQFVDQFRRDGAVRLNNQELRTDLNARLADEDAAESNIDAKKERGWTDAELRERFGADSTTFPRSARAYSEDLRAKIAQYDEQIAAEKAKPNPNQRNIEVFEEEARYWKNKSDEAAAQTLEMEQSIRKNGSISDYVTQRVRKLKRSLANADESLELSGVDALLFLNNTFGLGKFGVEPEFVTRLREARDRDSAVHEEKKGMRVDERGEVLPEEAQRLTDEQKQQGPKGSARRPSPLAGY